FTLAVPAVLKASGAVAREAGPQDRGAPSASSTILIVEDDEHFARILADLAREKGFHPLLASGGQEGLELARSRQPTCIVLAHRLPDKEGLQVLKALKEDRATRSIPVHMTSIDDHSHEAKRLGAFGY